jgi:hypothetical protein
MIVTRLKRSQPATLWDGIESRLTAISTITSSLFLPLSSLCYDSSPPEGAKGLDCIKRARNRLIDDSYDRLGIHLASVPEPSTVEMIDAEDSKQQKGSAASVLCRKMEHDTALERKSIRSDHHLDEDEPQIEAHIVSSSSKDDNHVESGFKTAETAAFETTYPEGGYGYVVVFACILVGACTAGSVSALGIYQAEYAERFPEKSSFEVNLIGGFMGFVRDSQAYHDLSAC